MRPFPVDVAPFQTIAQLFPFIEAPTPLQQQAANVALPDGPQLWIMEDVTGAGKTEAALTLASRMMSAGQAKGLYIGLPTMATANGIYNRMADDYRRLFTEQSQPSLVLAHSARELSQTFTDSVHLSQQQQDRSYQPDELSASAFCNSWLADSRKKALFAELGVGTLDQALLAVLPARHQSLRLLALSERILLVDEVHAYDPYMQTLLERLLQAHAAQGGSAILLSATLPQKIRRSLCQAFRAGLGADKPQLKKGDYPLLTGCSADSQLLEHYIPSRAEVSRNLALVRLDSPEQVKAKICAALQAGQAVCWIRNTVGDARAAWQQACDEGWTAPERLMLFHSRFALCDRVTVEAEVLSRFGKQSDSTQRRGQLLIATQVVEQSLDLDFDFMVTDLAPIDLLIQRAGRLHRHSRDVEGNPVDKDQRPPPLLAIHAPAPVADADAHWLKPHWQGSQWVYQDMGQLWLTLDSLQQQRWQLRMPEDARTLIEHVYGEDAPFTVPEGLEDSSLDAEGQRSAEKRQAMVNRLDLTKGYCRDSSNGGWEEEMATPTRLADETVTVVLVRLRQEELQPWCNEGLHRWQRSQISLPEKDWRIARQQIPEALTEKISQLKENVTELRWAELLPLVDGLADCYSAEGGWLKPE
ncbi:MAG: CRISPR-associated helicase Cas3' [Marinobacterium sp.]|nr:CRISPR-associated helicase Cas3' [Marinobacterium sp.]